MIRPCKLAWEALQKTLRLMVVKVSYDQPLSSVDKTLSNRIIFWSFIALGILTVYCVYIGNH